MIHRFRPGFLMLWLGGVAFNVPGLSGLDSMPAVSVDMDYDDRQFPRRREGRHVHAGPVRIGTNLKRRRLRYQQ